MKKIFTFLLLITIMSFAVSAIEFTAGGINYNLISATDLTCEVITGDYSGEVTVPSSVSYNGKTLTVINIAEDAFRGCADLTKVNLPNTIRNIEKNAFSMCPRLETFTVPGSVAVIKHAFVNSGIKELRFEKYLPWGDVGHNFEFGEIKDGLDRVRIFDRLPNLQKLYIDRTLPIEYSDMSYTTTNHYHTPFTDIETIEEIEFGPNVESTGYFFNCKGLKKVKIPAVDKFSLSYFAFWLDDNLKEIEGLEYVNNFGYSSLAGIHLDKWKINPQTAYIWKNAFTNSNIDKIELHNPDLTIESGAFAKCNDLKEVYINTNSIQSGFFSDCENLQDVTFSSNVTSKFINVVFKDVKKVKNLHVGAPEPPSQSGEFPDDMYVNTVLHVQPGSLDAYKTASVWKNFWNIVGDEEAGVNYLQSDYSYFITGRTVMFEGSKNFRIYDSKGICLCDKGLESFTLPQSGLYIIYCPDGRVQKIIVN